MINAFEINTLRQFKPLDALTPERLYEIYTLSSIQEYDEGSTVLTQEDIEGQAVYLLRGALSFITEDGFEERVVRAGSPEAAGSVINGATPVCSAVALTRSEIMVVNNDVLEYLLSWDRLIPDHEEAQDSVEQETGQHTAAVEPLPADIPPLFCTLPQSCLGEIISCMESVAVSKDEVIVNQGDAGDYYYLIVEGEAVVTRYVQLAGLSGGMAFGEEALLSENPRNATVTMKTDGKLKRISRQDFDRLLRQTLLDYVTPEHARILVNDGATWLDVRQPQEFGYTHMQSAINVPLSVLRELMPDLDRETLYICYCDDGQHSATAAFLLRQQGFQVCVLQGGLQSLPHLKRAV